MATLTWNEFRKAHKGIPLSETTKLWSDYKVGNYTLPTEDVPEEVTEEPVEETVEETVESTEDAKYALKVKYNELYSLCYQPGAEIDTSKASELKKMAEDFGNLMPSKLGVGWTLWLGPCQWGILENQSQNYAYIVSRRWWNTLFSGAALVEMQLHDEEETLLKMKERFVRQKRLIKRYPLPGIEFIVPKSKLEIPLARGD